MKKNMQSYSPAVIANQMMQVELKDIEFEPCLDRRNCGLREKLKAVCRDHEINLYAAFPSNSEQWIVSRVGSGLGVALMPEYTLPKRNEEIKWRCLAATTSAARCI